MAERLWQLELRQAGEISRTMMFLDGERDRLEKSATRRVAKMIGREDQRIQLGYWECLDSPTSKCIYVPAEDPMHDHCVFCHDPEERK